MTAVLSDLTPGTRVRVINAGHLNGKTGVVVGNPLHHPGGDIGPCYDIAVLLDDYPSALGRALAFLTHELTVTK